MAFGWEGCVVTVFFRAKASLNSEILSPSSQTSSMFKPLRQIAVGSPQTDPCTLDCSEISYSPNGHLSPKPLSSHKNELI